MQLSDFRREIEPDTLPGVLLTVSEKPSHSWFNGRPPLLPDFDWPHDSCDEPLSFLGCISLSEVQAICSFDWLPRRGTLLFFVNPDELYDEDEDTWKVVYSEHSVQCSGTQEPPDGSYEMPVTFVQFCAVKTPPPPGHPRLSRLELTGIEEYDLVMDLWQEIQGETSLGHVGGWHKAVQQSQPELDWQSKDGTDSGHTAWMHLLCISVSDEWDQSVSRLSHYAWVCFWNRSSCTIKGDFQQSRVSLTFN